MLLEGDVDNLPVQVPFVSQQVSFDLALAPVEGRCRAHVCACPVALSSHLHVARINTPRGHESTLVREHVGGWEAYGTTTSVALHYLASQQVRPPQEPGSLPPLADGNKLADPGRANVFSQRVSGDSIRLTTRLPHVSPEDAYVPRRLMAESEVLTDHHHSSTELPDQHLPHEFSRALLREF